MTGPGAPFPGHTDWLRQVLTVSGPAKFMAEFRRDATGPGLLPWHYPVEQMEQDWFLELAAPPEGEAPAISQAGARILSRRLGEALAARHLRVLESAEQAWTCPFDLHRLLPVPGRILALGPEDPESRAWLWTHWGTSRALRHVRLLPDRPDGRRKLSDQMRVEFWSADWSPWRALQRLRRQRPTLLFDLRPDYE